MASHRALLYTKIRLEIEASEINSVDFSFKSNLEKFPYISITEKSQDIKLLQGDYYISNPFQQISRRKSTTRGRASQ